MNSYGRATCGVYAQRWLAPTHFFRRLQILVSRQGEKLAEIVGADHLVEELHRPLKMTALETRIAHFAADGIHLFFQQLTV